MLRSSLACFTGLPCAMLLLGGLLGAPVAAPGDNVLPRQQPPGIHSTICTSDGEVRDDALATYVANEINAYGGQVKDVKIFMNNCYSGGFRDDFDLVFGPGGLCPGVPWVFGSAAEWNQFAWAFRADWCADPVANLGSKFTSALAGPHSGHWDPTPGAMRDLGSNNVQTDLNTARQHDEAGPNHDCDESPVIAVGNGGENITWDAPGTSHEVILFGGRMDQPAYYNDMENMENALLNLYGGAPHNIQVISGGTIQDLMDGVSAACANLDPNTQLVMHFTDHGGYMIDVPEVLQSQGQPPPPYSIPQFGDIVIWLPPVIPPPWPKDPNEPGDPNFPYDPNDLFGWGPRLVFVMAQPIESEEWTITLNGLPIPLPPGTLDGEQQVPVAWESFNETENHLTIAAVGEPSGPFVFDDMELSSGPVPMATEPVPVAAVCQALGYRFTAPWFPGSATPFSVPAQVDGPTWEQSGPLSYSYADARWADRQGFWGLSGPLQTATLKARVFNTDSPAEMQHVVIGADIMTNDPTDNVCNVVVQPAPGEGFTPEAARQPQVLHVTPNADGSMRCTWELDVTPIVPFDDVTITLRTGTGAGSYIFIDNLTIGVEGKPKDKPLGNPSYPPELQDKSQSHYYYFDSPEWPPAAHYEVLPTWHAGTQWERTGLSPPQWLADVTDHHGVMGLSGALATDGQLTVHVDDQAQLDGREYVSCQFDYYADGGGLVSWQPVLPPESVIENTHEDVEALEDGWVRVHLTFEAVPPPAWREFQWFMSTSGSGDPVGIDNFAMSASTWWADYWHDALDFYEPGLGVHGQYGWKGWDNDPLADALVTEEHARSPFNSVMVAGATNVVHEIDAPVDRWVFSTWQYVPGDFESGCDPNGACGTYFILMNTYQDGGPYDSSVSLHADSLTGSFIRDQQVPVAVPLVTDRWTRIDVVIDLTSDVYRVYYDGVELGTAASWTDGVYGGGGGALDVAAVELLANGSTAVYYDDLYLRRLVSGDLNCDGAINNFDINPFVLALTNPAAYDTTYPNCSRLNADCNEDGAVNNFDINPFVALLVGG